jgi:hypothetical protein
MTMPGDVPASHRPAGTSGGHADDSGADHAFTKTSTDLSTWLPGAGRDPVFPGRARIFGTVPPALAAAFELDAVTAAGEWPGAGPGILAAAAVGAAYAERARGGRVLAVLHIHAAAGDALVAAAADLAEALALDQLAFAGIADGGGDQGTDPSDFAAATGAPAPDATVTLWRPGQAGRWFLADDVTANPVLTMPVAGTRREWPPVHVHGLGPGGVPPWPIDAAHDGRQAAEAALAHVAAQTPALLRPHAEAPWSTLVPDVALLHALAQLTSEGVRVAWLLPRGTPLRPWLGALSAIGRRGLGLKLLVDAGDLPEVNALIALNSWWTLLPHDAHDTAAALAHALGHDDPVLIGLPPAPAPTTANPPTPPTPGAWTPGAGRWLAHGGAGTIVAAQATPVALALRQALLPQVCGVLRCNSLMPLPVADLLDAPRPLLVVEDAASRGLTAAITQLLTDPLLATTSPTTSPVGAGSVADAGSVGGGHRRMNAAPPPGPAIRLDVPRNALIPEAISTLLPRAKSILASV